MNKIIIASLCILLSSLTFADMPDYMKAGTYEKVRGHAELKGDYKFNLKCYTTLQKNWDFILSDPDGYTWWCFFRPERGVVS